MKRITLRLTPRQYEIVERAVWRYWHEFAVMPAPVLTPDEKFELFAMNRILVSKGRDRYTKKMKAQLYKTYGWKEGSKVD